MSSKGNPFHASTQGYYQAAVDRAVIKACLMGLLDDSKKPKKKKKKKK